MPEVGYRQPRCRRTVRVGRLSILAGIVALVIACSSVDARAQDDAEHGASRGRFFLGGSFLLSWTQGARDDPTGPGYLHPYFHGSLDWPVVGAMLNGGVFVGRRWSIGGEIAFRRAQSATISEDSQSHFETWQLSSLYTERERLASVVARWHVAAPVGVQPLGGVTVSQSTQALTNRQGWLQYYAGRLPIARPDREVHATRFGLVGGADVVFPIGRDLSIACGARLHWVGRREPESTSYAHEMPSAGPYVFEIAAGLTWGPRPR